MKRMAEVIKRIAEYDYVYDPQHRKNPGGGYVKTDKGWSKRRGGRGVSKHSLADTDPDVKGRIEKMRRRHPDIFDKGTPIEARDKKNVMEAMIRGEPENFKYDFEDYAKEQNLPIKAFSHGVIFEEEILPKLRNNPEISEKAYQDARKIPELFYKRGLDLVKEKWVEREKKWAERARNRDYALEKKRVRDNVHMMARRSPEDFKQTEEMNLLAGHVIETATKDIGSAIKSAENLALMVYGAYPLMRIGLAIEKRIQSDIGIGSPHVRETLEKLPDVFYERARAYLPALGSDYSTPLKIKKRDFGLE